MVSGDRSAARDLLDFQRRRFDRDAPEYGRHHGDVASQEYRDRFVRRRLFDFDLAGATVLDAMCAGGPDAGFLLDRGAEVTGLDISRGNAEEYERRWGLPCRVASIHDTGLASERFDVVSVDQGLHHVLPLLDEALGEIHRLLRPGGRFCFVEPNAANWADALRRAWYRLDGRFHRSERAIRYQSELRPRLELGFREEAHFEGGNVAYLLVAQSLIIGVPSAAKRRLRRPLFFLESLVDRLPGAPRLFFAGRWRKHGRAGSPSRSSVTPEP